MAKRKLVNDMKYHYTYRITNVKEGMYYYGVHSCDCLPKEDIGIKYWSSSKRDCFVDHQKQNPEQYKYKVIKIFGTRIEAVEHEMFLHYKFDVKIHEKFYNDSNQTSTGFDTTGKSPSKETRAKMSKNSSGILNPMFGKPKSEETKEKLRQANLGKKLTDETKQKISKANTGRQLTEESKENIRLSKLGELNPMFGKKHSEEVILKIKESSIGENNGMFGKKHSEETKALIGEKSSGKKHSEETKAIISATHLGKPKSLEHREAISRGKKGVKLKTSICPHCEKEGATANMNRYHFDNCKQKENLNG